MSKLISTVCAAALIGSVAIGPATIGPAGAAPLLVQPSISTDSSVIHVGNKGKRYKNGNYRHGKRRYYGGHNRYYRGGYNSYGWVVPGLIIGGIIVGSALSQPRYQYRQPAGTCGYWSQRCAANWSRPQDYRGCMRYYGCY